MRRALRLLIIASLGTGACNGLLDIQDAHVDGALEDAGRSGSSTGGLPASGGAHAAGSSGSPPTQSGSGGSLEPDQPEAGNAGSGGEGSAPEPTLCEAYCDVVLHHCSGDLEQYRSLGQCLEVCQRLPPGKPGDKDVNSVECRKRQAEYAESEPLSYCKSAGPLGQDKCGSNCASYCTLMQATCTPETTAGNLEPSYYADSAACLKACVGLTPAAEDAKSYSSSPSTMPSSYIGNNVFCRTYHVTAALEQAAPDEHCPHAMGGDPCIAF